VILFGGLFVSGRLTATLDEGMDARTEQKYPVIYGVVCFLAAVFGIYFGKTA
jgi:hypothetical protein